VTPAQKPKLAVVTTHPIPHFAPVFQRIAKNGRIDIVAIYLTDAGARNYYDKQFGRSLAWDIDLLSGYRHRVLRPGLDQVPKGFFKTDAPEVTKLLQEENPDAVLIYGYSRRLNWRVRGWTRANRKRLLYCSDSVLHRKRATWRLWLKTATLPAFFRHVDVCLTAGDCNEQYFLHYGVPATRLRRCPLPVDVARLRNANGADPAQLRRQKRGELNLNEKDFVVLFCGKLYSGKRPRDLLQAVSRLRAEGLPATGLFVGSGVLLDELKREAQASGYPSAFIFTGFVNQSELPAYFCAADALAIPSQDDAHPLVATEAAVFGLPLVVSDQVGCVGPTDVARPSENALVHPSGDVEMLSRHLQRLMQSPETAQAMSASSRRIVATQDITVAANAIEEVVLECRETQSN
jgi:glycosyltransferase involved in cell wall biosynthesis